MEAVVFPKVSGCDSQETSRSFESIAWTKGPNGCLQQQNRDDSTQKDFRNEGVSQRD